MLTIPLHKIIKAIKSGSSLCHIQPDQTSWPLISQLGSLTVKGIIDFEITCTVHKALKGLAPSYMQSMFHNRSESCNRTLRNTCTDLRIPLSKTSKRQRSFSYRGDWNQLSHEIKTVPPLATFKTKIKTILKIKEVDNLDQCSAQKFNLRIPFFINIFVLLSCILVFQVNIKCNLV